jgi:hypothetical protein
MLLPNNFLFSSNNLQDYLDCPRRFELKYILKQSWPAVSSLPVQEMEYKIRIGTQFHKVIHQYLAGIPAPDLEIFIQDGEIKNWFAVTQKYIEPLLKHPFLSEYSVIAPINGFHLVAVFDFISYQNDNKIVISDWKTTSRKPRRELFTQSVQTILYPFIAFEARNQIFSGSESLNQEDFSLEYFFPAFPDETISVDFDKNIYTANQVVILSLLNEINKKESGSFEKTSNEKRCAFCQYRSLCERGIQAGKLDDESIMESHSFLENLDFEQIDEIPF